MRIIAVSDGTINNIDRAIWLTMPFDVPFRSTGTEESISDNLNINQQIHFQLKKQITSTLTLSASITISHPLLKQISQSVSLTQAIFLLKSLNERFSDPLYLSQQCKTTSHLKIKFKTIGQETQLPVPKLFTISPYNSIKIPIYGLTDTNYKRDIGFSNVVFFEALMELTYQERTDLYNYFKNYRYNPFHIQIQEDIWLGYLTTNNQELFQSQFKNEISELTIRFEAFLLGKS